MPRLAKKVLLVGWDAADWKLIHPLLDAGQMPALQRLVERGVMGNLATLDPPLSPMLWTSIATGVTADRHGVVGFTQPRADGQGVQPVLGTSRRVKAFWNILSQNGLRSNVVGWWPSHPAEPIRGAMVSNFFHHPSGPYGAPWPLPPGAVHPAPLRDALAALRVHPAELTPAHILPFVPEAAAVDQDEDRSLAAIAKILAASASVQAAATYLMAHEPWDFTAVYFDAIDHFGHGFMRYHPPKLAGVPDALFQRYRHVMSGAYRWHDMLLERLLELAGPDATVILLSDHGFHSDHLRPRQIPTEPAGPAVEHRHHGIFVMAGPHVKQDEWIFGASLLDVAPTVLTLFGLPLGRDLAGKPLVQAFDHDVRPAFVDSWEDVPGDAGQHPPEYRVDPWAEQAAMAQLVALGYVDPPGEDVQQAVERSRQEAHYYLARVFLSTGRPEEALPLLEDLWARAPDQLRYGQRLAECYLELGRLDACRPVVEQLAAGGGKSENPLVDLLMGTLLLSEGRTEEAMPLLLRAEATELPRPVLHLRVGEAYLQRERWADAERAFHQALTIDPHHAHAHHGLARALLAQGRDAEAAEAALRAVALQPFFPGAHFRLGLALTRLGRYANAADAFRVCVHQAPGMSAAHRQLSRLYMWHLGEPARAAYHEQFVRTRIAPLHAPRQGGEAG